MKKLNGIQKTKIKKLNVGFHRALIMVSQFMGGGRNANIYRKKFFSYLDYQERLTQSNHLLALNKPLQGSPEEQLLPI